MSKKAVFSCVSTELTDVYNARENLGDAVGRLVWACEERERKAVAAEKRAIKAEARAQKLRDEAVAAEERTRKLRDGLVREKTIRAHIKEPWAPQNPQRKYIYHQEWDDFLPGEMYVRIGGESMKMEQLYRVNMLEREWRYT